MTSDDLEFRTFAARDDGFAADPDVRGWIQAVARGFHEGRFDDDMVERFTRHAVADDALLRGTWAPTSAARSALADPHLPVATFISWQQDLNVGGERLLPLHMITDVTVSPTHRRRGLLRRLMGEDLADAAARGLPLAALTVSEGSIYGRFGFGPATAARTIEVDVTERFAFRPEVRSADGELVLLAPGEEAARAVEQVFARFHAGTRGSVRRPAFFEDFSREGFDHESRSADGKRHVCVLLIDGEPAGYVAYRPEGHSERHGGRPLVKVFDLVAPDPAAALRLWRFLADLDLIERVEWRGAPLRYPLDWAVTDPRVVRTTAWGDRIWLRVLDVVAALEARPWGVDGEVVLEVDDPLGFAAGRYRVAVRGGRAEVSRVDDEALDVATVRLAADTLASLYLGGTDVATLAGAGRITGPEDAVATWAALADVGPDPYAVTGF